ncbi:Fucose permease [Lachnospiraceae bacterium NK3A20]|nr:Fucose permease [Lachnospiraceae bacterium NK3A20]
MRQRLQTSWRATIYASYAGYITQAIINSFLPLLFLTLQREFQLSLSRITFLVTFNFGIQLFVDFASAKLVDRIGYRVSIVAAHVFAAVGLLLLGTLPYVLPVPYYGILFCVMLYAVGGGLTEVLISPIVEACPTDDKAAAMSFLHSFYCWGVVGVIVLSTLYFHIFGIGNWRYLAMLWAILPSVNALVYSQVPIRHLVEKGERMSVRGLAKTVLFWILLLMMICAGASEQAMSQWASAFAERALGVGKTFGDLLGACMFSILMGTARVIHAKLTYIDGKKYQVFCSILALSGYLLAVFAPLPALGLAGCGLVGFAVGAMWPGTFNLAAAGMPRGGTALFAFLALAGDIGCSSGPTLTGLVASAAGDNLKMGLLFAMIFPILMICAVWLLQRNEASAAAAGAAQPE